METKKIRKKMIVNEYVTWLKSKLAEDRPVSYKRGRRGELGTTETSTSDLRTLRAVAL